ncbi:MAG: DUF4389 domain-containing protein [Chloroflexi bacterium]|nr:DUF4389 domain-containing protein [Chloroflexota bacterium]MCY3697369.1 DUF4389 domain-containing protein [Chloroflexota bacterium]MXX32221.1 DUF4389 domain-containing protein [Chloroflexota bacterium]MYB23485.1 DUF4389 domain-containing protein [Chloroflexota bacterium]MYD16971.1 DUF4389 domain-containing protein [Chloroflexota bacterium]
MQRDADDYPARLDIEYPQSLDRISTLLRPLFAIPILILMNFMSQAIVIPVLLMLVFRQKYPRWWFDFNLELARLSNRVNAYLNLMTDQYPSTDEEQSVRLDLDYPDAAQLSRWLPLVKWLLAVPHYIVLGFLVFLQFFAVLIAWFAIVFTGAYPRPLFTYMLNVERWLLRVEAYAFLLITDRYPPFRLG